MLMRLAYALGVWVLVALVCYLLGLLMATIGAPVVPQIGGWLRDYAAIIGLVAGLVYFIFGRK